MPNSNNSPVANVTALLGGSSSEAGAGSSSDASALTGQLTSITQQLQQLQTINQQQIESIEQNTQAVGENTSAKGSSGDSTGSKVGSTLEDVFGAGLSPLITGLISLFGGGGSSQPAPLSPYVAPLPVNATAGISASSAGAFTVDTGDAGLPRPVPASSSSAGQQTTNITVQVQALDTQSFLDHSDDIAQAVRLAMLTSTTLNDVIRAV